MYGLNMFALLVFCAILKLSGRFRNVRAASVALLTVNLIRYGLPPVLGYPLALPVEFSSVSYFAVPVIALSGWRPAEVWAAYAGLLAGTCYFATMAAAGGPIYDAYPHWDIYLSMFCHGSLFLIGASILRTRMFRKKEAWKLALGFAAIAANALAVRPLAENGTRLFIYELLDAQYARPFLPQALIPLYFLALFGALYLTIRLFFHLNRMLYKKKAPRHIHVPAQKSTVPA
jgi:hypothetical protein